MTLQPADAVAAHPDRPRVAIVQTAPEVGQVEANVAHAVDRIHALRGRADLVVFPELFTTGYRREGMDHASLAEKVPEGPSLQRLARAASESKVTLVGSVLEQAGSSVHDTSVVVGADGSLIARYRKTHLYPAESPYFDAGDELVVASLDTGTRIGLAICFEHAFPEIFTSLALAGASLIVISSAVPVGFEYLLDLRTRARAQDNQVFVASANLVGFDGQTRWCGRSAIVDPRGEVIAQADGTDEASLVAELDMALVASERYQEPALAHRRPELYGGLPMPPAAQESG